MPAMSKRDPVMPAMPKDGQLMQATSMSQGAR